MEQKDVGIPSLKSSHSKVSSDAELALGKSENSSLTVAHECRPDRSCESIDVAIANWVAETVVSRERLLLVELGRKWISMPYVAKVLGVPLAEISARDYMIEPVDKAMRDAGIIVNGHPYSACDWRRKLMQWFETLSAQERIILPLHNGRIKIGWCLDNIPSLELNHASASHELVSQTLSEIAQEVIKRQEAEANPRQPEDFQSVGEYDRISGSARNIRGWASEVISDRNALLEIPLTSDSDLFISRRYLESLHGVSSDELTEHQGVIASVVKAMTEQGIIIEGYSAASCDARRRLLAWFEGLTYQQKCELPLHGGTLKYQGCIDYVEGVGPGMRADSLFLSTIEDISEHIVKIRESIAPPTMINGAEAFNIFQDWVANFDLSRESLLTLALSRNSGEPKVSVKFISSCTSLNGAAVRKNWHLASGLVDAMIAQQIILPGYSSYECDWRRRLMAWYESFSPAEKLKISIFGNKIKIKGGLDSVDSLKGIRHVLNLPLILITLDEITSDLRSAGLVSDDYKTVAERTAEKPLNYGCQNAITLDRFLKYRNISVGSVVDLAVDDQEPFLSLYHLFAVSSMGSHCRSGISNYNESFKHFRDGLIDSGCDGHESIQELIGKYSLVRFKKYLEGLMIEGRLSSKTCQSYLSAARKMMQTAVCVRDFGLPSFIAAEGFETSAETDLYRPYTPTERLRISDAISSAITSINELIKPYIRSSVGCDPLNKNGFIRRGYSTLENAQWIFENKLNCAPIDYKTVDMNDPYQRAFLSILKTLSVSICDIYRRWGILHSEGSSVLTPFIARLSQVTGLNADSLKSLNVHDFVEKHPLTNRPCLRYWKERSIGEREYHLDIFEATITWLTTSQGCEVKKIFEQVIAITSGFRNEASDEVASKLFIYRSSSNKMSDQINSLEGSGSAIINKMFARFVTQYDLKLDSGERLSISPSRFRPSFVSELVERGVSLREIQVILGHKSIFTTLCYLDRLDLNRISRKVLDEALSGIHSRTVKNKPGPKVNHSPETEIIFKTPMGGCRNIFNPPEFIKNLRGYIPGRPCSLYNKCLACDNRIITKANLPELFAMRRDYQSLIETTRVLDSPYGDALLENLALLDQILDPVLSNFTANELEEAERLSGYLITSAAIEGVTQ